MVEQSFVVLLRLCSRGGLNLCSAVMIVVIVAADDNNNANGSDKDNNKATGNKV